MRLAFRPDIIATPIADALRRRGWEIIEDEDPGSLIAGGRADVAIGPALGYGKHLGLIDYALVPGFAVILNGPTGLLRLVFPPGREELTRIAVRSRMATETIVAGLILIEKHDIEPEFIDFPEDADLATMLQGCDGAVVFGEESILSELAGRSALDLGDEWNDMTGEPLPWLLAWGRSDSVGEGPLEDLRAAREEVVRSLPTIAAESENPEVVAHLHQRVLSGAVEIGIETDETADRLTPFFHYAFYHGIISDIPTIKYLPIDPIDDLIPGEG